MKTIFTICSVNYLNYAKTFIDSALKTNKNVDLYLCVVDEVDAPSKISDRLQNCNVVLAKDLGIDSFLDMTIRYDVTELNTAIKPFVFKYLFNLGYEHCIYLDPDIFIFDSLSSIFDLLEDGNSAVFTPHITAPKQDKKIPNDHSFLQSGVFNLGFVAFAKTSEAEGFLEWWGQKLLTQCLADLPHGLFVDQKWCDLAPCFISKIIILRNQRYNVAYWNLEQCDIKLNIDKTYEVNGEKLCFFHFSGLTSEPNIISKYQNRFDGFPNEVIEGLFLMYRELLSSNKDEFHNIEYTYSRTSSGIKINNHIRNIYNRKTPDIKKWSNNIELEKYIIGICNKVVSRYSANLTELMIEIYQSRPDLKLAFDIETKQGAKDYKIWFSVGGQREYELEQIFLKREH